MQKIILILLLLPILSLHPITKQSYLTVRNQALVGAGEGALSGWTIMSGWEGNVYVSPLKFIAAGACGATLALVYASRGLSISGSGQQYQGNVLLNSLPPTCINADLKPEDLTLFMTSQMATDSYTGAQRLLLVTHLRLEQAEIRFTNARKDPELREECGNKLGRILAHKNTVLQHLHAIESTPAFEGAPLDLTSSAGADFLAQDKALVAALRKKHGLNHSFLYPLIGSRK